VEPTQNTPAETPAPTAGDLSAPEYRQHREAGTSVADLVKARAPAADPADAAPSSSAEAASPEPAPARDESGRFAKPVETPKAGNPRHDPRARIDELTRKNAEATRRAEAAEAERERYKLELDAYRRGEGPKPDKPAEPAKAEAKAAEKFTYRAYEAWAAEAANEGRTYEDYLDDRSEARIEHREQAAKAKQAEEAQAQSAQQAFQTFTERQATFKAAHPDFDQLVQRSPAAQMTTPPWIGYAIVHSEHGPALQYHLLQHPDEAKRIFALDPPAAVVALARLEASFTSEPAASTVPAAPALPVTKADPPFETVGASASASTRSLGSAAAAGDHGRYRQLRESGVRL